MEPSTLTANIEGRRDKGPVRLPPTQTLTHIPFLHTHTHTPHSTPFLTPTSSKVEDPQRVAVDSVQSEAEGANVWNGSGG
jgi:hypothetical protein